jgi:hypothetical protein
MDWDPVWERLRKGFAEVIETVKQTYPAISAGAPSPHARGFAQFEAYASFWYKPEAEAEDLILWFSCARPDRGEFWDEQGRRIFPGVSDRDAVGFWIEGGKGGRIAAMDPVLLPPDRGSSEYEQAVLEFTDRVVKFMRERMDLILDALREPQYR